MNTWNWRAAVWLAWLAVGGLSGCKMRVETPATALMDATQAYQTVQALVSQGRPTQTDMAGAPAPQPDATHTSSPSPAVPRLSEVSPTLSPSATPLPPSPTAVCDRAAAGNPIDVTIPDETEFQPEQSFTKIWRLVNVGTCTWTRRYAARFFYGSLMEAPDVAYLAQEVPPGQSVEIAVDMVAPETPGTHQGNWKLQNADDQLFGIGPSGDAPFWVRIVVALPATATPTLTLTPSATPTLTPVPTITATATMSATATSTQQAAAGGAVMLQNGQALDLDTGILDTGGTDDVAYQVDGSGFHVLTPQVGSVLGVSGQVEPNLASCQGASMSAAPMALESLSPGSYLCYQTDQALYGWLRYNSLDGVSQALSLDFRTWSIP